MTAMSAPGVPDAASTWPPGTGAMTARVRSHDWEATPLGPVARWPARLRQAVELCLDAAMPMAVLWGPSLVVLPNDALAARWPGGGTCPLGLPYAELQPEAWAFEGARLARALATGEPQSVPGFWRGRVRAGDPPAGGSFACTPLRDDAGAVRGLLACGVEAPSRDAIDRLVHELRDPLAPLRNSLELLRMSRDGVEVALVHEMLERQVQAMVRAVDRLLEGPAAEGGERAPIAAGVSAGAGGAGGAAAGAPAGERREPAAPVEATRSAAAPVRRDDDPRDLAWPRRRRLAERPAEPAEGGIDDDADLHDLFEVAAAAVGATLPRGVPLEEPVIARRVLVVDDHRDAADSLALLLSHLGTEVRVAYGGDEALALLEGWIPEAVLLDLEMPGLDGFEVARRVRANPRLRGLPLVALTGHGQGTDMRRTRAAGIDHHLVKPVRLDVLVDVLASLDGDGDDEDETRH